MAAHEHEWHVVYVDYDGGGAPSAELSCACGEVSYSAVV